jgi:hypothetical protein
MMMGPASRAHISEILDPPSEALRAALNERTAQAIACASGSSLCRCSSCSNPPTLTKTDKGLWRIECLASSCVVEPVERAGLFEAIGDWNSARYREACEKDRAYRDQSAGRFGLDTGMDAEVRQQRDSLVALISSLRRSP